jgi:hypothetical protein
VRDPGGFQEKTKEEKKKKEKMIKKMIKKGHTQID